MKKPAQRISFLEFIQDQGVVGLAIAFILGGAIQKVISSLVGDILQPIIGLVFGSTSGLSSLHIGALQYGHFLANMLDFLLIAWIVYLLFKHLGLERFDGHKEHKK